MTAAIAKAMPVVESILGRLWAHFLATTRKVLRHLDMRLETMMGAWAGFILLVAILKVATAPTDPTSFAEALGMAFPFLVLGAAPVIGYRLAAGAFPKGKISEQPIVRLARYGKWRPADPLDRRREIAAGPAGFLVSLIVGILLNVPWRTLKFLAIVPAVAPSDPSWGHAFVACFTLQAAIMTFLYMICFVMGLRNAPLFPRMLLFVWLADIVSQLLLASALASAGLPSFLVPLLITSLEENMLHVLIAIGLWLPYLLVSDQVNLRFRARVRSS